MVAWGGFDHKPMSINTWDALVIKKSENAQVKEKNTEYLTSF